MPAIFKLNTNSYPIGNPILHAAGLSVKNNFLTETAQIAPQLQPYQCGNFPLRKFGILLLTPSKSILELPVKRKLSNTGLTHLLSNPDFRYILSRMKHNSTPPLRYRIEGMARRGRIMHAHLVGRPGQWQVFGPAGLHLYTNARSMEDALEKIRRKLPFRLIAVRTVESSTGESDNPNSAT